MNPNLLGVETEYVLYNIKIKLSVLREYIIVGSKIIWENWCYKTRSWNCWSKCWIMYVFSQLNSAAKDSCSHWHHCDGTVIFQYSMGIDPNYNYTIYLYTRLNNLKKKVSKANAGSLNATGKKSEQDCFLLPIAYWKAFWNVLKSIILSSLGKWVQLTIKYLIV